MKNIYALDKNHNLIHIDDVKKEFKKKYTCCNCNGELIARKGQKKAHHFSHKSKNCSYESYLHKVSKIKFYETYSQCLNDNVPFYLEYKTGLECISCKEKEHIYCKLKPKVNRYDLTKYFDKISIEKGVNGFIADVLLESTLKEDKILIEFAVTHKCEKEKIENGLRIIEVELKSEDDLKFIDYKYISLSNDKINLLNFTVNCKTAKHIDPKKCGEKFEFFSILKDNRALKIKKSMSQICSEIELDKFKYYKILKKQEDEYNGQDFIHLVQRYALKDKRFKNCYSCRFSAKNNNYYAEYSLFCKRLKCGVPNSNFGSDCNKYWLLV